MYEKEDCWAVRIQGDVRICVRPTLNQMTTYVMLEQEDWFEDEMAFIRSYVTPEMNALDIGANHGVYALSMASRLRTGRVWAFEPTRMAGEMLKRSIELNGFSDRVKWVHAGLSDHEAEAEIHTSLNSELSSLHGGQGFTERIHLTTLDAFLESSQIDLPFAFVKLDVEGEEVNVLKGAQHFFAQQSPLVMFELKHGDIVNQGLIDAFRGMGYGIFRLLPGPNVLIEYTPDFQDTYLLNLFACKPDLFADLEARGLAASLVQIRDETQDLVPNPSAWEAYLKRLPYARILWQQWTEAKGQIPQT